MKIISGGQSGVDRAALDVAIERGLDWGGWCPKGAGRKISRAPGLLAKVSTPQGDRAVAPLQRTEWNVRDSNASLIITDGKGLAPSIGTGRALQWARQHGKPFLVLDASAAGAPAHAAAWLRQLKQRFGAELTLGVGGPRESEAPGIYALAKTLLAATLRPPALKARRARRPWLSLPLSSRLFPACFLCVLPRSGPPRRRHGRGGQTPRPSNRRRFRASFFAGAPSTLTGTKPSRLSPVRRKGSCRDRRGARSSGWSICLMAGEAACGTAVRS